MKVMVAVDQTPNWKQVVEAVANRSWPCDTDFKFLTVLKPVEWQDFKKLRDQNALKELEKLREKHVQEILKEGREIILNAVPDSTVHTDLRHGSPRCQILDAAAEFMPDKIILGAHGLRPNRLLPAATSRSVAQYAHCSVELVRLKQT